MGPQRHLNGATAGVAARMVARHPGAGQACVCTPPTPRFAPVVLDRHQVLQQNVRVINWLRTFFFGGKLELPADQAMQASPPTTATFSREAPVSATASSANANHAAVFMAWLLGCGLPHEGALTTAEQRALAALDKTLALPTLPDELLPRSAALIPQLLALLRQTDLPVPALAQRVSKDVLLTAEVLRLASSPFYRAQGAVSDLEQAIAMIGVAGVQKVIARVVLKPIFDSAPGPLSARAGSRLWDHAEALAKQTAELAAQANLPAFDGYLAGLLHSSGWTIALRLLDRSTLALPPSHAFASACADRAHRLFGQAARRWSITPGFNALGQDAMSHSLAQSTQPLAMALRAAQGLALADLIASATNASP
jgi:HDOD domain